MYETDRCEKGFTLVELITVLVIIAIVAATSTSFIAPSRTAQMQAARDQILGALSSAQQYAMSRKRAIRVVTSSSQIDIQQDTDGDGDFSPYSSISIGNILYPQTLPGGHSLNSDTLVFNRLGQTSATTLTLSYGGVDISIVVTGSGYAY